MDFSTLFHGFDPAVDLPLLFTLILLEGVLSFDNAAVLASMCMRLPPEQRRKALLYGLVGAYVFRFVAILGAAFIIENRIFRVLGGLYLVWLMVSHLWERGEAQADGTRLRKPPRIPGLSAFWATVVVIEFTDVAFALDQVVAAVGLAGEDKLLIIILASFAAIVLLRVSAFYMTRLMTWFPMLERLAYIAVGFVGLKLLAASYFGDDVVHEFLPTGVSVAVTFSLIVLPVVAKALYDVIRGRKLAGSPPVI